MYKNWGDIIGMNIAAIGILRGDKRKKIRLPGIWEWPDFVFLGDGETFIRFEGQDPYTYHDADNNARTYNIVQNKEQYNNFMTSPDYLITFTSREGI